MRRGRRRDLQCRELVELVTEYLEDALDPPRRTAVEQHLRRCEGCQAYLAQMRQTLRVLGRIPLDPARELPGSVRRDLLAAFRAGHPG